MTEHLIKEKSAKNIRTLSGIVISDKMLGSAIVSVERHVKHPIYGKYMRRATKFHIHDPENQCKQGDTVSIKEFRPVSKTKSWVLVDIIEKAQ